MLEEMLSIGVSGILLVTSDQKNTRRFDSILDKNIPIIFLERMEQIKDYTSDIFDNNQMVNSITTSILNN